MSEPVDLVIKGDPRGVAESKPTDDHVEVLAGERPRAVAAMPRRESSDSTTVKRLVIR